MVAWADHPALGGEAGLPCPAFDFRLPGVTSISADTHKYGYSAKGTSVIFTAGYELRHYQYSAMTDFGGRHSTFSPTFPGSRPGRAECHAPGGHGSRWASRDNLEAARRILRTPPGLLREMRPDPRN